MTRAPAARLAQLGLSGLCVPEEYGGMGRQVVMMTAVLSELARHSSALAGLYNMCCGYGAMKVSESGPEDPAPKLSNDLLN